MEERPSRWRCQSKGGGRPVVPPQPPPRHPSHLAASCPAPGARRAAVGAVQVVGRESHPGCGLLFPWTSGTSCLLTPGTPLMLGVECLSQAHAWLLGEGRPRGLFLGIPGAGAQPPLPSRQRPLPVPAPLPVAWGWEGNEALSWPTPPTRGFPAPADVSQTQLRLRGG